MTKAKDTKEKAAKQSGVKKLSRKQMNELRGGITCPGGTGQNLTVCIRSYSATGGIARYDLVQGGCTGGRTIALCTGSASNCLCASDIRTGSPVISPNFNPTPSGGYSPTSPLPTGGTSSGGTSSGGGSYSGGGGSGAGPYGGY